MFAVVKTGGKQYRVTAEDKLEVERLAGEAGDIIELNEVLMVGSDSGIEVGTPTVEGATVAAEILEQGRGPKIIIFKKKRRKHYRRKNGHRQDLTSLRITEILTGGKKPSKKAAAKKEAPEEAAPAAEDAKKAEELKAEKKPAAKKAPAAQAKEAPAALFATPDGEPDDLKKISGVGPALEKKLHGLGITKFEQIAAFTAEDIEKVDDALSFKGRIERDDWLGQAKKLAAGEDPA